MRGFATLLGLVLFSLQAAGCGQTGSPALDTTSDRDSPVTAPEVVAPPVPPSQDTGTADAGDPAGRAAPYGSAYGIRPAYEACMTDQPDAMSTAGHRQDCADQEFAFQDARLNRVYREAMEAHKARDDGGKEETSKLRDAQRLWLSQLDEICADAAEMAGSAMGPAAQSTCLMDETAKRAHALERDELRAGH